MSYRAQVIGSVVMLLLSLIMLSGCSQKPQDAIVGAWHDTNSGTILTFTKEVCKAEECGIGVYDGWLYIRDETGEPVGVYQFLDNDTIALRGYMGNMAVDVEMDGEMLFFLSMRLGSPIIILTRVRE